MTANAQTNPDHIISLRQLWMPGVILTGLFFGTFATSPVAAASVAGQPQTGGQGLATADHIGRTEPDLSAFEALDTDPDAADAVANLLQNPSHQIVILDQLNRRTSIPTRLWRSVSRLTSADQSPKVRVAAVRAVTRFGTRESVETLVALSQDADATVASYAIRGLSHLTGLDQAPEQWSGEQWADWGKTASTWTDRTWARMLITQQAELRRKSDASVQSLRDSTLDLYRRLHVELDAEGRSLLLAELIDDDRVWLRSLGFELAGRDLSARTALGEAVAISAAAQLASADPLTRANAAILIGRLVPPDAMLLFTQALRTELFPKPAEPMLLGIARWPNPDAADDAVRWLERDDAPLDAACTAVWSLTSAGFLEQESLQARVIKSLRARPLERIGLQGMRTLVVLGDRSDLDRMTAVIENPENPLRDAAAEALAERQEGLERLLQIAPDPRLFRTIAQSISRHEQTVEGFARIAGLACLDESSKSAALVRHATLLKPELLAEAVEVAQPSASVIEQILTPLMATDADASPAIADGLLLLAETRLGLGDVAASAEVLALLGEASVSQDNEKRRSLIRLRVALRLENVDEAFAIEGLSAADWVTVLGELDEGNASRGMAADRLLINSIDTMNKDQITALESWATQRESEPSDGEAAPPQEAEPNGVNAEEDASDESEASGDG